MSMFFKVRALDLLKVFGENKIKYSPNGGCSWWFTVVESKKSPYTNPIDKWTYKTYQNIISDGTPPNNGGKVYRDLLADKKSPFNG